MSSRGAGEGDREWACRGKRGKAKGGTGSPRLASERDDTGRLSLILTLLSCTEKRDMCRLVCNRGFSIENAFYRPEVGRRTRWWCIGNFCARRKEREIEIEKEKSVYLVPGASPLRIQYTNAMIYYICISAC